ncbi:5'-deoxynucleotidase HDDC2 isoform X1 [Malaya genurostris]|uniref:5'-deoxynucleotidase HDDC2 isoform X1 n=2 Tax=Malaya genurostris TaxID=325434 RepID=UPI0026F394B5|nr:5'-deoxynucleotidase HDDC2 isoform X1 [Malaya genurostris]
MLTIYRLSTKLKRQSFDLCSKLSKIVMSRETHINGKMELPSVNGISTTETEEKTSKYSDYVKFLELVGNLKHTKRTGWVLRNVKDCESISGHMYRMGLMSFLLDGSQGLDRIRVMELALIHDLAESIVGDITPYCGISREEKLLREFSAMSEIAALLGPCKDRLLDLFNEYEAGKTAEAKFVKDLDRLDMVLQAFEYEKRDNCPMKHQEFFDSTEGKFSHPFVINIVNEINAQRVKFAEKSARCVSDNSSPTRKAASGGSR